MIQWLQQKKEGVNDTKEHGLWPLVIILCPFAIIIIIAKGITKNMGFVGKTIVWILAIAAMLVVVGMLIVVLFA